ncbi:periplasmic binding protein-like I [Hyaloraphidium curvatum]|nr:periplasmic binding protein-like I [Hyaloraphidium curvatum]
MGSESSSWDDVQHLDAWICSVGPFLRELRTFGSRAWAELTSPQPGQRCPIWRSDIFLPALAEGSATPAPDRRRRLRARTAPTVEQPGARPGRRRGSAAESSRRKGPHAVQQGAPAAPRPTPAARGTPPETPAMAGDRARRPRGRAAPPAAVPCPACPPPSPGRAHAAGPRTVRIARRGPIRLGAAMAAAAALALPALLLGFLGSAAAVDLRIAALLPDQNPFYDAMYEMMDMTVREEQGNGILATHNFGLEYTIYEFDQGYLESDINTFANNSVVGFVGPNWSNDTALALSVAVNQSIPVCDGGATAMFSGYPQFFRTIPSDVQAAAGALSFVQSKNWGAAVLITTTDAYGTSMAASYEAARQQSGSPVRVVGPFYFDPVTPFDESLGQMPTVEGTVGCSNIVNAVKSTGVQIVLFAVDAFQMFSCFPHLERAGMLTRDYVYITHDAGTEYYWRFGGHLIPLPLRAAGLTLLCRRSRHPEVRQLDRHALPQGPDPRGRPRRL